MKNAHIGYNLARRLDDFYHHGPKPVPAWVIVRVKELFTATGRRRSA